MCLALLRARYLDADAPRSPSGTERPTLTRTPARRSTSRPGERRADTRASIIARPARAGPPTSTGRAGQVSKRFRAGRARTPLRRCQGLFKAERRAAPALRQATFSAHFADVLSESAARWSNTGTPGATLFTSSSTALSRRLRCALALQDVPCLTRPSEAEELPPQHLALRLGAHIGPVFPTHDPVLDEARLHGLARQPHRANRAGDAAGERSIVTEPFAAALALRGEE